MTELAHILSKARQTHDGGDVGFGVLSTGDKLAVAFVLNRPDRIAAMGYTLAEAVDRIGAEWLLLIPQAARQLAYYAESD